MEKLSKDIENNLSNITRLVKESSEYKKCLELKEKMDTNQELTSLVNKVKRLQKQYIRTNYSPDVKEKLDKSLEELNEIPIYVTYNNNLEKVNEMINLINDELNAYFTKKLNEDIKFD